MDKKPNNNRRSNNNRSKKPYRKEERYDKIKGKEEEERGKKIPDLRNDWRYYAISEQLAKAVGNLPYNSLPGMAVKLNPQGSVTGMTWEDGSIGYIPSVMQIQYTPSIGYSGDDQSAINIAAKRLYTYVRHANSGAKVYEAPDLMMYIIAMENCYRLWWEARRAYQICFEYNAQNRNLPIVVGAAANLGVTDSIADLAQANFHLNLLRNKINSFWVPDIFNSFKRAAVIANGVFMDSDSYRGQFYIFTMTKYYLFSGKTSEKGSELVATDATGAYTLSQKLALVETAINALISDDDINTMSGDMMKAFKDSERFSLPEVPSIDKLQIAFDEDILAQIENSCTISLTDNATMNITQDASSIIFKPTARVSTTLGIFEQLMWGSNKIFNSHKDNPDYTDNLEWSRDICGVLADGTPYFGAEIIENYNMWYFGDDGMVTGTMINSYLAENTTDSGAKGCKVSQFDWHPTIYYCRRDGNSFKGVGFYADLKYYAVLSGDTVSNLHKCAIQALYYATSLPF